MFVSFEAVLAIKVSATAVVSAGILTWIAAVTRKVTPKALPVDFKHEISQQSSLPLGDMLRTFLSHPIAFLNPFNKEYRLVMSHDAYRKVINNAHFPGNGRPYFVMADYFPVGTKCVFVHFRF